MEIYWLGHGCFRLRGRDAVVLTDPCPPATGYRIGRVAADVVTVSDKAPENNHRSAVTGEPKFIDGAGEYEIAGVLITGVRTDHDRNNTDGRGRNVAYVIDLDDVRIFQLGDISQVPSSDDAETLSTADVLIVPVGGGRVLDAEKAAETVSLLAPKLVIPMQYKTEASTGQLDGIDRFLKEMGAEAKSPEARISVTKSNLPEDTSVVLLNYRGG
jgi:L-ascorbate metabolism protein UlaG (beta-lactamase superfamily)